MSTLHAIIHENVREGELFEKLDGNWVRCFACGHCCKIPEGQPGVCKVRYNRGGTLFVPSGYGPATAAGSRKACEVTQF
jgi:pyruvate formate lyase activating enzyme